MATLTYKIEVALGGTLTDVTDLVDGFVCGGGRQREFELFSAGTCTFTIDDRTGDYIPEAGGLYSSETWVGREVKITATVAGVDYTLWRGHVDDIDVEIQGWFAGLVTVTAVEPLALLGYTEIDDGTTFSSELSSTRVDNVLALAEVDADYWTSDTLDVGVGQVTLQAESDASGSTLQYLQKVSQSEFGRLYVTHGLAGGVLTFRGRSATSADRGVTFQDDSAGSVSLVDGGTAETTSFETTYDGGNAAGESYDDTYTDIYGMQDALDGGDATNRFDIPTDGDPDVQFGSESLVTRVTYTREGGTAQTVETDPFPHPQYGIRQATVSGLLNNDDADVLSAAEERLLRNRAPRRTVQRLTVGAHLLTDGQAALLFESTVGDRARFRLSPVGYASNGTMDGTVRVEKVTHRVTHETHRVDLQVTELPDPPAIYDTDVYNDPDAIYGV